MSPYPDRVPYTPPAEHQAHPVGPGVYEVRGPIVRDFYVRFDGPKGFAPPVMSVEFRDINSNSGRLAYNESGADRLIRTAIEAFEKCFGRPFKP